MGIQGESKARILGAAAIAALMLVCSIAAFAGLTASSGSIQFPNQAVATTSAPMSVIITNASSNSTTIVGANLTDSEFAYVGPSLPLTLGAGQSFTAQVTFTPRAAYSCSGTLTFNRSNGPRLRVFVSGTGIAAVTPTPTSLTTSMSAIAFTAQAGGAAPSAKNVMVGSNPSGAVPFTVSADQAWIALSTTSATTSSAIQVGANINGMAAGNYNGHLIVTAAGVTNAPVSIPVTLSVTAPPPPPTTYALTVAPSAIAFTAQAGSAAPAAQSVMIGTNPAAAMAFTVSADQAWIVLGATSGTTSSAIQVGANINGMAAGNYSGHVIVSPAGVTNGPVSIPVTLSVTAPPPPPTSYALTAAPSTMALSGVASGAAPATQSLTIGENPAGAAAFTASADQAWLTLSANSGTTPSAIQVGANTTGLAAGNYTAHVLVSATGVTNSPMSVTVTLAVTAAPTPSPYVMYAAPTAVAFTAVMGTTPACQSVTVDDTTPSGPLPVAISADAAWLTVTPTTGNTKIIVSVCAKTTGLTGGTLTGHVLVAATGPNTAGYTVNNSPLSIPVTLTITTAPTGGTLTVNPTSVAFGSINVANNNTKNVTLTNSGSSSVTISQVNVVGLGLSANGITTPMVLSAGQTTVLSIVYSPTVLGLMAGSVTVVSDATNSPSVIVATGTGVQPQLSASPAALNFGNVTVGSSGTQTITLSNTGSSAASISQATISGAGFTMSGMTLPMTLAAGTSSSFTVQFTPTAAGTVSGGVTVTSNTPNSPTIVGLNGTGTAVVSHSVSLSWNASTSTVVGYNVYRGSVSGGPYTLLGEVPSLSYTDSTVVSGQTYYYVVTAVDANGNESVVSNEVAVIIP